MPTQTRPNRRSQPDTYMSLIRRCALKPIKNDREHGQAVGIVQELMGRELDSGASDYLDTLILLVNKYEDENHTPRGVGLSPRQALRAIMSANGIAQAEMGRIIGSESAVSMFLKGERELSKAHIKALVARFRVDAGLFLCGTMSMGNPLGIGPLRPRSDSVQSIEYVVIQHVLDRIFAFTGRSIHDVVNDPIARNEVFGYYKLHREVQRTCESIDLERQWNPTGAVKG